MAKYTHLERDKALRIIAEMMLRNKHDGDIKRALRSSGYDFSGTTYKSWKRDATDQIRDRTEGDPRDLAAVQVAILERSQAQALEDRDAQGVAATNKRIAAMCGLDAPAKAELTVNVNIRAELFAVLTDVCEKAMKELPKEVQAQVLPYFDQMWERAKPLLEK